MAQACGSEAIVIGAGMGGLAAAMALSRHFERMTVVDRDKLPSGNPESEPPRRGIVMRSCSAGSRVVKMIQARI
jgi:phytoene dehydrogenase-like protein